MERQWQTSENKSTKPNANLYVCPGTHGQSEEDAQCAPSWVEKIRAYDYLDDLSVNVVVYLLPLPQRNERINSLISQHCFKTKKQNLLRVIHNKVTSTSLLMTIAINQMFFLNKNNDGTFQAATLQFLFAWSHFALTRGDDLRTTGTSWAILVFLIFLRSVSLTVGIFF